MGFFTKKRKDAVLCPNCRKPAAEGAAFCDSCGLRITPPPACSKCKIPLAPDTNFCESCGTPVSGLSAPAEGQKPAEGDGRSLRKKEKSGRNGRSKKKKSPKDESRVPATPAEDIPVPENTPTGPEPDQHTTETEEDVPAKTLPPSPAPVTAEHARTRKIFKKVFFAAFSLLLILLVVLITAPGIFHDMTPPVPSHHPEAPDTGTVETILPVTETAVAAPALVAGPTQVPPDNLRVWFQAERDPVTNIVSVLFNGGKGQLGVREVLVQLTRSDGQVLTWTFKPTTTGEGASLMGTKYTDRVVVIVSYYNGDEYTVIDKVFEYKKRN